MLQLKYRRREYYTTLLKLLPCKHQSSLRYFAMSNGVNKLELGYESLFYGLWHIIFLWAGEWTSQSWVMMSVHPKWQCTLPGFECHSLANSTFSSPEFYRWGNWGRVERWDQPWSPKWRTRESWHAPCSLRSQSRALCVWEPSSAPSENPKGGSCESLTPLSQELPELPRELSAWGLYKQHALPNSRA